MSRKLTIILLFLFSTANVTAQTFILKGKVVDEKAVPVTAASVFLKGTSVGTSTDFKGKFSLRLKSLPVTIVFSCVGYGKTERKLQRKDLKDSLINIDITLIPAKNELTEVVVTSLGQVRQYKELGFATASVSSSAPVTTKNTLRRDAAVDDATLRDRTPLGMTSLERDLSGKVSGVSTTSPREKITLTEPKKATLDPMDVTPINKRSRLLTAGELNDFKKWKMWEDYNNTEFKIYSEQWQLFATERYCVQLLNKERKAVVGEKLYLLDNTTGDTLWKAISDNTGKAELWNGFTGKKENQSLVIAVEKERKQFSAIPFTQGINRIVIDRSCAVSNKAEIAFVVDATGSMQDEINYLKEELEDVLAKITTKDPGLDLHTAAVFYRDNGDEYLTKIQQFTSGTNNTIGFIRQQNSGGGGDYPEAVNEGLKAAIEKLQWSADARTRIIFLLMDAPPHDEAKAAMATLIKEAAMKGVRIVPVACSGTNKATEFIMRSMALATNGSYLYLTDDSGIGNPHIKPTTDEIKVELLNDLLQRVIGQMCYVNTCNDSITVQEPVAFYNNTENIKVFPNPTTGPVTIQTTKKLKELFVADFTGKLLMRIKVNLKSNYHFNLAAFPAGTYFIKYLTEENKTGTEKLVLVK